MLRSGNIGCWYDEQCTDPPNRLIAHARLVSNRMRKRHPTGDFECLGLQLTTNRTTWSDAV
jgi:hypothetical protein